MITTKIMFKVGIDKRKDFLEAENVFNKLVTFMSETEIQNMLADTHKLHAKSGEIQDIILGKTKELGFTSEKNGLFNNLSVKQLRPDYYRKLDNKSGIIMEVERGKTIANNMDLLDIWKCHICDEANFLFLIIPNIRQTATGQNIIFKTVERRMLTFFETENYTNVDGVFLIGY
jgi:hypothetical protein